MRISHPKDFLAGALFILVGGAAMAMAAGLTIGSAAKMGPGYFPFALGAFLAALGAVLLLRSLTAAKRAQEWPVLHFKPVAVVLLSVVLFSQVLRPLGLVASTVGLVLLASTASHEFRWKEALLNAAVLVVVVLTVFVYFLEFQMAIWPQLISGRV